MIRKIRDHWIKGSVTVYVICVVGYNFLGKATMGWTDFYYTFEKGFAFLSTLFHIQKPTLSDRIFIDYARFTQGGTWMFFILASFNNPLWVYNQTVTISTLILASFGTVCVQWYVMKNLLK